MKAVTRKRKPLNCAENEITQANEIKLSNQPLQEIGAGSTSLQDGVYLVQEWRVFYLKGHLVYERPKFWILVGFPYYQDSKAEATYHFLRIVDSHLSAFPDSFVWANIP